MIIVLNLALDCLPGYGENLLRYSSAARNADVLSVLTSFACEPVLTNWLGLIRPLPPEHMLLLGGFIARALIKGDDEGYLPSDSLVPGSEVCLSFSLTASLRNSFIIYPRPLPAIFSLIKSLFVDKTAQIFQFTWRKNTVGNR